MHSKLRIGGLAAVVSATTLVLPFVAIQAAQAAPAVDLSITKTVASAEPPVTFIPELSDTLGAATVEFTGAGLHVATADNAAHAAEHWALDAPMPSSVTMNWSGTAIKPGTHIMFDVDNTFGNGNDFNVLVGETVYGGDFWYTGGTGRAALRGFTCPSTAGGSGSDCHGTLSQWQATISSGHMYAAGFSLGTGAVGDGYITGMTYGSTQFDFTRHYTSSLQAAPGEAVEYKIAVANNGDAAATNATVIDTLPADLTPVNGTLISNGNACGFVGQQLTCTTGLFPPGISTNVYFQAKVSDTVSSAGLSPTIGHIVDVQKQEVFADLPAGATKTYSAFCPTGYVATDGGLLLDAVDQGGDYSDIVIVRSKPAAAQSGINGWTVTASNLGEQRGQGKVKVTCLDETIGSSNGHTHTIDVTDSTAQATISASSNNTNGELVTVSCPTGYTPIAPEHTVTSGIAVIRSSYAVGNTWKWMVDHAQGTAAPFAVDCLAPETASTNGHTATLPLTTQLDTISVGPESRDEGIEQCGSNANAITGGYTSPDASVLSLGKEPRGNNYMCRFYNQDWEKAWNADIQVTCVGVRTADEPQYYHITNTATVTSPDAPTRSSSADIAIVGDPVQPAAGVLVGPNGNRSGADGSIKKVSLRFTCTADCSFTVKLIKGGNVVAKATKSLAASPNPRWVYVPTTSAGKNLSHGDVVTARVKTSTATTNTSVTLN